LTSTPEPGHAALMDGVYRYQRHFYDATRKFFLLGRDRLIAELDPPAGGAVLEVGCGTGRNMIVAARRWPQARFYGLDISEQMLATAREKIAAAGLTDRITLAQADATDFNPESLFGRRDFDRVFLSYSLSMIPDWRGALRNSADVVAPGGALQAVDFGDQSGWPGAARRVLLWWLAKFHVSPRLDLPEALRDTAETAGLEVDPVKPLHAGFAIFLRAARPDAPRR
jgi:S-adenosylmethionine-diacylgycerolhomoserine-N-methlytransferase